MKKILLTLIGVVAGAALVHAQGNISMTLLSAAISTNSTFYATGYPTTAGGVTGHIGGGNGFYFALLAATSTSAGDAGNPNGPDWAALSPVQNISGTASNAIAVGVNGGGVSGPGGSSGFSSSLTAGTTYDMMVVGWSANLGTTWAAVSALFAENFVGYSGGGFAGYSNVGQITPTTAPATAASVFGGAGAQNGQTILYALPVPEPTTIALAGLGGLAALALRRRKA